MFADELARFAADRADLRVTAVAERAAAPLRVAVCGRRGVGRTTVARALGRAPGISITAGVDAGVDVVVYVLTEVVKPEDAAAIQATARSVLAVLNKADLAALAGARPRCAEFAARVRMPVEPMSGLLAVAAQQGLGPGQWAALRAIAADPGGATCLDGSFAGFLTADLPVTADARLRLLDRLDVFGTVLCVAALRRGATPAQVRALLRRTSGVDAVVAGIAAAGAEARYRRVLRAVAELEALAVSHDPGIRDFLSRDDTVVARMAAAVDLAEAAGLDPIGDDDPAAHLPRARRWQRYGRSPLSDLHRACAADITRGSLRLWSRARVPGEVR